MQVNKLGKIVIYFIFVLLLLLIVFIKTELDNERLDSENTQFMKDIEEKSKQIQVRKDFR